MFQVTKNYNQHYIVEFFVTMLAFILQKVS